MSRITFHELEVSNKTRCEQAYHPIAEWSPTDWACAMGGECGEALNLVKKLRRLTGPTDRKTLAVIQNATESGLVAAIGEELADVVIYADLLSTRLGLSLGNCVVAKFNATSRKVSSPVML